MTAPHANEVHLESPPETQEHTWSLRAVEFEDGATARCFECTTCGAVRYEE